MKKSSLLIVDDEQVGRDMLKILLVNESYELFFACNGEEALKKSLEIKPDLILLDIMMPEIDGFEVCRHIRNEPLLCEIPVIMLTTLDDRRSRLKGIEAGADDFISKPYDIVELKSRIKTITRLNRYRRLIDERSRFEWVVDHAEDGYIMINKRDKILYANPKARIYLGISDDTGDDIKETFLDIAGKQYNFKPKDLWTRWPEITEDSSLVPLYLVRPESTHSDPFWIEVKPAEMLSSVDETYLVRLRNTTEKMISRKNTWTFHKIVGHKLRTPLNAMGGILDFLHTDVSMFSGEELKGFISDVYNASSRIQNQIQDVLHFIEAREILKPSLGICNAGELPSLLEEIKKSLTLESVNISLEIEDAHNKYISFSIGAMEMVLKELLLNSKKFHPEGSPSIEIRIMPLADNMCIKVCDNGISLSPVQLIKMWVPYYQAEKHFTGEIPGMGLGLSTVASMIWNAGGTCKSYNRQNGPGIIIEIILPLKKEIDVEHDYK